VIALFGDIRNAALVREAVAGSKVVFNAAGIVATWGTSLAFLHEVHIAAAQNVLQTVESGARIVHTSSVVAIGAAHGKSLDEHADWNLQNLGVDYVRAKRSAEELMLAADRRKCDVVVVNPSYLIGPEDYTPSVMGRFLIRFWEGRIPIAPPGGLNLVDVRDVAQGHLLAAEHGQRGRRYILAGHNVWFRDMLPLLASVGRIRFYAHLSLPHRLEWLLALLMEARSYVNRKEPYPSVQHCRMNRFAWFFDSGRACHELGYGIRSLTESIQDTYSWHNAQHPIRPTILSRLWLRWAS
jgi:dihydroflavonol-4-reductase